MNALLRQLPQVEAVLQSPLLAAALTQWRRDVLLHTVREQIEAARQQLLETAGKGDRPDAGLPSIEVIAQRSLARLAALGRSAPRRVVNATGVLLHTNLGRAVLSAAAQQALTDIASGYCDLELDLSTGKRTRRDVTLEPLLTALTGCEAATVVNNCAAAVYLSLYTLARGKEVITSRGELVEIGGSFRVPEVVRASGCRLVEVGSTNKTRLADYAAALTPKTALLLKTHTSNYRIRGFTEEASIEELAALGRQHGVPLLVDLGSGLTDSFSGADGSVGATGSPTPDEPDVLSTLAAGADLLCFSGDKLLGGPQAGILCGRRALIEKLRRSPMWRALRIDKFTLAALHATLLERLQEEPPQWQLRAQAGIDKLRAEAEALRTLLQAANAAGEYEVSAAAGSYGGGSLPEESIASFAVCISLPGFTADRLDKRMRSSGVVGYISAGRYALNVLSLLEGDAQRIATAVQGLAHA